MNKSFIDRTDQVLFWMSVDSAAMSVVLGILVSPDLGLGLALGACLLVAARVVHQRATKLKPVSPSRHEPPVFISGSASNCVFKNNVFGVGPDWRPGDER